MSTCEAREIHTEVCAFLREIGMGFMVEVNRVPIWQDY